MAARLILNADDFGLTRGINRAIAELHAAGALTSATLMANGAAFDDAVAIAKAHPTLGVGCHIVLIDGTPVSPPETVPTLLGKDGRTFRSSLLAFTISVLCGKVEEGEIEREALAQIQKLQRSGIAVTHADSHKHTHVLPSVSRPLLRAMEQVGVRAVRNPFEQSWSFALGSSGLPRVLLVRLARILRPRFLSLPQIHSRSVLTTDGTIGIAVTGNLNTSTIGSILAALPEGTWELCCHPGYNDIDLDAVVTRLRDSRDIERDALLTELPRISSHRNPLHLIHYGELESSTPYYLPSTPCERSKP